MQKELSILRRKTELIWTGKEDCIKGNNFTCNKRLVFIKTKSINPDLTKNIYIEGDNLDGLRLLQKDYAEKIKVIYIDPPYNTGKDFTYRDRFKSSDWCSMMYPRLEFARKLLSDDGVIFISINDNELCKLRLMCDEIFGEENFVNQFIYERTQHFGRHKQNSYSNAEYILCYAKQLYDKKIKTLLVENINTEFLDAPLYNASNNVSVLTFPAGTVKFNLKDGIYKKSAAQKYQLMCDVKVINGKNANEFSLKFKSRWSQNKILEEIKKGTYFWIKSDNFAIRAVYGQNKISLNAPKQIIFTNKNNKFCTENRFGQYVTTNETASKELEKLVGKTDFSYPKPLSLITYLLSLIYDCRKNEFDKNFTVLDFFSGSATTAQAVMELNSLDKGTRNFILIQSPENINNDKYKTLCELGEARIREAGKIYKSSDIDTGMRVYGVRD